VDFIRTAEIDKQEQQLRNIATFLREVCIPKLITALSTTDKKLLSDTRGLTEVFHRYGVNMRYLGQVHQHKLVVEQPQIRLAL